MGYHKGVHFVTQNGIMQGTGSNTFSPDENTSRAMLVTILYRISGSPSVFGLDRFKDIQRNSYYEIPVLWAERLCLTNGTSKTTFTPDDPVTRQDLAVFFMRYIAMRGYSTSQAANLSRYTDNGELSDYARRAMEWAVAIGAVNGVSPDRLAPQANATRAEIAAIIQRIMNYYNLSVSASPSKVNPGLQNSIQNMLNKSNGNCGIYVEQLGTGASIYARKNTGTTAGSSVQA